MSAQEAWLESLLCEELKSERSIKAELLAALQVAQSMILTLTNREWEGWNDTDIANNLRIDAAIAKATRRAA